VTPIQPRSPSLPKCFAKPTLRSNAELRHSPDLPEAHNEEIVLADGPGTRSDPFWSLLARVGQCRFGARCPALANRRLERGARGVGLFKVVIPSEAEGSPVRRERKGESAEESQVPPVSRGPRTGRARSRSFELTTLCNFLI
jgi:hypothetical protein